MTIGEFSRLQSVLEKELEGAEPDKAPEIKKRVLEGWGLTPEEFDGLVKGVGREALTGGDGEEVAGKNYWKIKSELMNKGLSSLEDELKEFAARASKKSQAELRQELEERIANLENQRKKIENSLQKAISEIKGKVLGKEDILKLQKKYSEKDFPGILKELEKSKQEIKALEKQLIDERDDVGYNMDKLEEDINLLGKAIIKLYEERAQQ